MTTRKTRRRRAKAGSDIRRKPRSTRARVGIALAVAALGAPVAVTSLSNAAPLAPHGGQRVDMKVLLLANSASDADATAWEDNLKREGTPYTRINASDDGTLTDATFASGNRAFYQAVIAVGANGTQPDGRADAFTPEEWAALRAFEAKFAIRQIDPNAVPGPSLGSAYGTGGGQMDGLTGTVTAAGKTQFPDLAGTVLFKDLDPAVNETFGSGTSGGCDPAAANCLATSYTPLVTATVAGQANSSIVGLAAMKDGREEISVSFSGNENQLHSQILRHALLSWVTGGVYIGMDRTYFSMDIDDIFLPDTKWDPVTNKTPGDGSALNPDPSGVEPGEVDVRMLAGDVTKLEAWQNANGVKVNLLFNGGGHAEAIDTTPPTRDALFDKLKADKAQFNWISHTWSHPSLGSPNEPLNSPDQATIRSEITQNIQFAQGRGVDQLGLAAANFNPTELVTGEHSGIGTSKEANSPTGVVPVSPPNVNMAPALNATGIRSIGADNSREAGQRAVGNALTLPRYPMNVFYNIATMHDQLDEYDWLYLSKAAGYVDPSSGDEGVPGTPSATTPPRGNCTNNATTTCFTTPVTKAQYLDRESTAVLTHMLGNDPRPHYAHQPNLMSDAANTSAASRGDGILYQVLTPAIATYKTYRTTPILQPGMTALREQLRRQTAWAATSASQVSGYIQDGKVVLTSTVSRDVPLTGTTTGDVYGGRRSGWLAVTPGTRTLDIGDPRNTAAPTVTGTPVQGNTLTASTGTWTGTPTITYAYQWQRRANATAAWSDIPTATTNSYVVSPDDTGQQLRVVVAAQNAISTWSLAPSTASTGLGVVTAPANTAPPTITGTPRFASTLTASTGTWSGTTPLTFTYQWQRSTNATTWSNITSATRSTYSLGISDINARIRVVVTATNPAGSAASTSAAAGPVRLL
jgi:hypothetical protein